MYLLYVDHSGEVANPGDNYFVMGGAAVFERQIYFIKQELERLQQEYLPDEEPEQVEFHASVIRNHSKPPWDKMLKTEREKLMLAIYEVIANAHSPGLCLFGQAIEKSCVIPNFASLISRALQNKREAELEVKKARGDDRVQAKQKLVEAQNQISELISPIISRGFEGLCTQFEFFLRRFHEAQPSREQRGLIVVDHASYEKELELLLEEFRTYGTRSVELYNIVEAPFCMGSESTRMLQIADFVSYAIFRRYESKDTLYFDLVNRRFDELSVVIHGLAHVTTDPRCMCPACLSRTIVKKRT